MFYKFFAELQTLYTVHWQYMCYVKMEKIWAFVFILRISQKGQQKFWFCSAETVIRKIVMQTSQFCYIFIRRFKHVVVPSLTLH